MDVRFALDSGLHHLVKGSIRLYLVHEHRARVPRLVLPYGAYQSKLGYGSSDNLTEVMFIFYASMLTMSKK